MAIETNLNKRIVTGEDIDVTVALTTTAKKVHPAVNELKTLIDNQPIKDLTTLTTQAAVWTELEKGGNELVKLTISGFTSLYTFKKSGTHWFGTSVINDGTKAELRGTTVTETGGALAFSISTLVTKVSTPTSDDDAANKKYVDDNAGGSSPTWKNITADLATHDFSNDVGKIVRISFGDYIFSGTLCVNVGDPTSPVDLTQYYVSASFKTAKIFSKESDVYAWNSINGRTNIWHNSFKDGSPISISQLSGTVTKFEIYEIGGNS